VVDVCVAVVVLCVFAVDDTVKEVSVAVAVVRVTDTSVAVADVTVSVVVSVVVELVWVTVVPHHRTEITHTLSNCSYYRLIFQVHILDRAREPRAITHTDFYNLVRYASTRGELALKTVPLWQGHTQPKRIPEWFKARSYALTRAKTTHAPRTHARLSLFLMAGDWRKAWTGP
jgi:hypothetical protein